MLDTVTWVSDITRAPPDLNSIHLTCWFALQNPRQRCSRTETRSSSIYTWRTSSSIRGNKEQVKCQPNSQRSTSPRYYFGSSGPRFYQQSIIQSRYQALRLKELALQRSGWKEKRASETKPLQQQECQEVSKGADCRLKGWGPALLLTFWNWAIRVPSPLPYYHTPLPENLFWSQRVNRPELVTEGMSRLHKLYDSLLWNIGISFLHLRS